MNIFRLKNQNNDDAKEQIKSKFDSIKALARQKSKWNH